MTFNELASLYAEKTHLYNYFEARREQIVLLKEKILNYVKFICDDIISLVSEEEIEMIIKQRFLMVHVIKNEHKYWLMDDNNNVHSTIDYEISQYMELISFIKDKYFSEKIFPTYVISVTLKLDLNSRNIELDIHVDPQRREKVDFGELCEDLMFIFKGSKVLLSRTLFTNTLHLEYINL